MSLLLATSGNIASGVVEAEGVDFDGVNDYLSRSTDLVGNVDSKTFTFSAWVYTTIIEPFIISIGGASRKFSLNLEESGVGVRIRLTALNSSNTTILSVTDSEILPLNTFVHISISIDLTSTLKRHIYVNDISRTGLSWNAYTNSAIDFATSTFPITIGAYSDGAGFKIKGRLSDIFLDYTYRDLSIEANRRLFITADGKPTPMTTLKALNPILYLPMKDSATAHINEGTGGNFTLNGTIATSERGANQDNCVASYFDGSADYLSKTTITGIATTVATISGTFKLHVSGADGAIWFIGGNTTYQFHIRYVDATSSLYIYGKNVANVEVFRVTYPIIKNKEYHFTLSFDITDTNKRHLEINGAIVSPTWAAYNTAETLRAFTASYIGASSSPAVLFNGDIGELYYNNIYIDLATSNPFWDAVENKPIPVRKVIANTGVTPLIAMPIDASNAGKNYGTGGDFTANSAPYVGARGASEFWARSAKFDGSTGYLSKGTMGTTTKTISAFFFANSVNLTSRGIVSAANGVNDRFSVYIGSTSGTLTIVAKSLTNSNVIIATTSITFSANTWFSCFISIDLTSTATRQIVINGVVDTGVTWSLYNTAENIYLADATEWRVGEHARTDLNYFLEGNIGSSYLTSQYIDFSQEVNRLKFIDGLGYPLDLAKQIEAGVIPNPLIYLPFNDPSNLGLNLGTGGNFTVNGTVTQGADVNG